MVSRDVGLALGGTIIAIVLIVLDKAGKLRGPILLWFLALAAVLTLPLALGNQWVIEAPSNMLKLARGVLMLCCVGLAYSVIAVWISGPNSSAAFLETVSRGKQAKQGAVENPKVPTAQPEEQSRSGEPLEKGPETRSRAMSKPVQRPPKATPEATERNRGDISFREVTPEALGFKPNVPDIFSVEAGTNQSMFPTELLAKNVPFERLLGIKLVGDLPLRIWFNENGELRIDATLYERKNRVGAVIKNNDFSILTMAWDRNWDDKALEIVDERSNPIFQISRPAWNMIRVRGLFITSEGAVVLMTDEKIVQNPTSPANPPARIFKYPSSRHLHERVTPP